MPPRRRPAEDPSTRRGTAVPDGPPRGRDARGGADRDPRGGPGRDARGGAGRDPRGGPGRRRAQHSLEAVVDAAIELLDEAGEPALTFRALAARIGGGVGSIYWYVASKDELLDRASDAVAERLLIRARPLAESGDPFENLRALGIAFYETMLEHQWLASYIMRNVAVQPHSLALYELIGQQTLGLDLTVRQRFHAVSAIVNYVTGVGAELGQVSAAETEHVDRGSYLEWQAQVWRAADPATFPFVHEIADEFAAHEDADQFTAGLDLLLAGLR